MVKILFVLLILLNSVVSQGAKTEKCNNCCNTPLEETSETDKKSGMFVKTIVSNPNPYKYQPFIYTVKLYSKRAAKDIRLEPLAIENISVKQLSFNKVSLEKHKGSDINAVESSYLITPLNDKPIIIPSLKVSGSYSEIHNQRFAGFITNDYGHQNSVVEEKFVEFSLKSKGSTVNVLPPVDNVTPWIPAESLTITENIEATQYKIGEPIIRTITINAQGIRANQLPDIFDDLQNNENYKIYSETPELKDDIKNNKITSFKKIKYTIMPQEPGDIILPATSITWWNVNKLKFVTSQVDAKVINIKAPAGYISKTQIPEPEATNSGLVENKQSGMLFVDKLSNFLLYTLYITIIASIMYLFYSKARKINFTTKFKRIWNSNRFKQINTPKDLARYLKEHAHHKFNLPLNSSLNTIFITFKSSNPKLAAKYDTLQKLLENALYAGEKIEIEQLKKDFVILLQTKNPKKVRKKTNKNKTLPKLNYTK